MSNMELLSWRAEKPSRFKLTRESAIEMVQYALDGYRAEAIAKRMRVTPNAIVNRFCNQLNIGYREVLLKAKEGMTAAEIVDSSPRFRATVDAPAEFSLPQYRDDVHNILHRVSLILADHDVKAVQELREAVYAIPIGAQRNGEAA